MRFAGKFHRWVGCASLLATLGSALLLSSTAGAEESAGSVRELEGQAYAERSAARRALAPQAAIMLRDRVKTGDKSLVTLLLGGRTTLRLGERGSVLIDKFLVEAGGEITLQSGPLMLEHPEAGPPQPVQIRTSYGLIAVRGTRVFVGPERQALAVFVERGEVAVRAGGRTVTLRSGEGTAIPRRGARPSPVTQWTAKRIDAVFGSIR
jgi:hypothetical protein